MMMQLKIGSAPIAPRIYVCRRGRVHIETSCQRLTMTVTEFRAALRAAGWELKEPGQLSAPNSDTVFAEGVTGRRS